MPTAPLRYRRSSDTGRTVQAFIETLRPQLADLCRRFHVRRLDLFGSALREDFDPSRSDADLLVEFEPKSPLKALDQYFGLKQALEELFGRPVDLVVLGAVKNPYLRAEIDRKPGDPLCSVTPGPTSGTPARPPTPRA